MVSIGYKEKIMRDEMAGLSEAWLSGYCTRSDEVTQIVSEFFSDDQELCSKLLEKLNLFKKSP